MTQQLPEKPGTWQAKVFLAYASEDKDVALAMQAAIDDYPSSKKGGTISVRPWQVADELSASILQNLQSKIRDNHFGIFIYTPVDREEGRESKRKARDNVVFETGLFIGKKGTEHTIILLPKDHEVTPSDLAGIVCIEYPYDGVKGAADQTEGASILGPIGAKVANWIKKVMDQSSAYQDEPATGQPPSGTSTGQPPSALEMISAGLASQAAQNKLNRLDGDIWEGRLAVHAVYGVGRVMAWDPPEAKPRYITVQFGLVTGRFDMSELFVASIGP
jgi:predicted nucleotide-binding protein